MLPFLILALQAVPAAAPAKPAPAPAPVAPEKEPPRFTQCMDLATGDPVRGQMDAIQWRTTGGGVLARQCLGVAYANQEKWAAAAGAFEDAAREAETGKDPRAPNYWASAGNAWIAAGDPTKARAAIDAALATGTLAGLDLGEAHLDRARAMVAAGDMEAARSDIDKALTYADKDPLAWLLSATLARRAGDLGRAARDVTEALRRAPDDPSVQLEAGNVAAASGNEADARTAWNRAIELAPGTGIATAARKALEQFSATEKQAWIFREPAGVRGTDAQDRVRAWRAWGSLVVSGAAGDIFDAGRITAHGWETFARRALVASLYAGLIAMVHRGAWPMITRRSGRASARDI